MPCGRGLLAGKASGVQVCGQVAGGRMGGAVAHHEGDRDLAETCIRPGDDSGLPHRGVRDEQVFDVAGGELLATTIDDVLQPPGNGDETRVVEDPDVASAKP